MEVTVKFNQQEINDFLSHLDQSVRSGGIKSAPSALALLKKLEDAVNSANSALTSKKEEGVV